MSRITKITIRRFKRLEQIDLPLADVTLLVGANNSGKSSVLQAIHFAVAIAQTSKLIGSVNWQLGNYELSFNPTQLLYSPVSDVLTLATGGRLQEARPTQIEIQFARDDGESCVVSLRRGRNRNIAVSIEGRSLGEQLQDLEHPFSIYAPGLAGIPRQEQFLSAGVVRRIVARGDANLVLRNVLLLLKQNSNGWERFLTWIRGIFPELDLNIEFNSQTDEYINALFSYQAGPLLPIDFAGTSILQACQLLSYIALFNPKILILDEPDSHFHPDNQKKMLSSISDIAREQDIQVLISTHSRHVLDAARRMASTIWLSKGEVVETPDPTTLDVLLDIGALDSVDFFASGEAKCVVVTEDANPQALETLLWASGFREDETYIGSYSGASKVESAEVLGSFLKQKAPRITTLIHRDRDYLPQETIDSYSARINNAGLVPFITSSNDVEAYFVNPDHLAHLNPGLARERIVQLIDQAVQATREETLKVMINSRMEYGYIRRRDGGQPPDAGEIAVQAAAEYDAQPLSFARGKIVLGRLMGLLQDELGARPAVFQQSPFIAIPELVEVAHGIWPPER